MEVVGKRAATISQSSAWTTPLNLSDQDQPLRPRSVAMQTNSSHRISASTSSKTPNPFSTPPHPRVDLPLHHPEPVRHSSSSSSLVRSESAPINILEESSCSTTLSQVPEFCNLSVSPRQNHVLDSDIPHSSFSHPMNFAAAAASGVSSHAPMASPPLAPHGGSGQRRPPHPGTNKPPPSRSLSSVELAAIVNGVRTPGIAAVPARVGLSTNGGGAPPATDGSVQKEGVAGSTAPGRQRKGRMSAEPAWHKSVFDMIQDDFPKTPAPMFSSMSPSSRGPGGTQDDALKVSPESRMPSSDRRARLASTASLDLDLDRTGTGTDSANSFNVFRASEGEKRPREIPTRNHHRRSVSINWTGDVSGLGTDMSRTSSRSNLASSPTGPALFGGKHGDIPPVPTSSSPAATVPPSGNVSTLPMAIAASTSSSPTQSLSPTGSVQLVGLGLPPSQAPVSGPRASQGASARVHGTANVHHQLSQYPVPSNGPESSRRRSMDELGVAGLADYGYFGDQGHSSVVPSSAGNPGSMFATQGFSSGAGSHAGGPGFTSPVGQHIGAPSQYANVFPGMGLFPSPFSNTGGSIPNGAGAGPGYNESFRDGLTAADDLKNMSMQMAAFINAQQQLYAAQMAQMAAMAESSGYSGNLGAFTNALPGGSLSHVGAAPQMRSSWDAREHSGSQRNMPRSKHHFDQYRGVGSHAPNQKKSHGVELGHKGRGGRSRRGNRGHDEVAIVGGHKAGDRGGLGNTSGTGLQDPSHMRSPLLEEFRATSLSIGRSIGSVGDVSSGTGYGASCYGQSVQNGREWQLSEIKNNVVEFATDQHGSRFIQQKLESASAQDKDSILKYALTDAQRLMTDVFGNYVVQKLLDHGGGNAVKHIAAELEGRMLVLSLHMYGCRVVQKALEVLKSGARATLVRELDGHVLKCIRDQNGNHVIQKCVELVESNAIQFIVDSVQGQAVVLAGHSYGCRVVQRILEHGAPSQKAPLMLEIMSCIAELIKDQYGNYVIQHVVEHGTMAERSTIMNLVRDQVCQLSQHKFASNVVERCLQHGSPEERQVLIEILIVGEGGSSSSPLNHLVRDQFGNYVVQRVLDVARHPQRERVVTILRAQVPAIKKYSYGKHIIARLEEHQSPSGSIYHHTQSIHHHPGTTHPSLHRGERHVRPQVMPVGAVHGMPPSTHDFVYYE